LDQRIVSPNIDLLVPIQTYATYMTETQRAHRDRSVSTPVQVNIPSQKPPMNLSLTEVSIPKNNSFPELLGIEEKFESEFELVETTQDHEELLPKNEEKLMKEITIKENRANVVVELGDRKAKSGDDLEALALYIKYLNIMQTVLLYLKKVVQTQKITATLSLKQTTERLRERFDDCLMRTELIKKRLKPTDQRLSAEKIMYDQALHLGREGAVDEMYDKIKSEFVYRNGLLLLEQLLIEATDPQDKKILKEYVSRFSLRLHEIQKKKEKK